MKATHEIDAERWRQIQKGFTPDHDDTLTDGSIALCAKMILDRCPLGDLQEWGLDRALHVTKKHTVRQRLIIAAALIVAEIERIDRTQATPAARDPAIARKTFFVDIGDGDWLIGDEDDLDAVEVALRDTLRPVLDEMLVDEESREIELSVHQMTLAQVEALPDV